MGEPSGVRLGPAYGFNPGLTVIMRRPIGRTGDSYNIGSKPIVLIAYAPPRPHCLVAQDLALSRR